MKSQKNLNNFGAMNWLKLENFGILYYYLLFYYSLLQVTIKFFKNKLFYVEKQGKIYSF
jgi:hypothetical protein